MRSSSNDHGGDENTTALVAAMRESERAPSLSENAVTVDGWGTTLTGSVSFTTCDPEDMSNCEWLYFYGVPLIRGTIVDE